MKSREETYAAVRKALAQLDDPFTRFLGPQQYQVAAAAMASAPSGQPWQRFGVRVIAAAAMHLNGQGRAGASCLG